MRIRSIKPEFWQGMQALPITWELIYDGPLPGRTNLIAPMTSRGEYVYLLFDSSDVLLYIGRSFRPADRFTKHRRRPWWPRVSGVAIVLVHEKARNEWLPWQACGPNTAAFEQAAIAALLPSENVAGRVA